MSTRHPTIVGAYEVGSFPSTQIETIHAYRKGLAAGLMFSDSQTDPVTTSLEFRDTGNCHVWIVRGVLIDGEERFPVLPWE